MCNKESQYRQSRVKYDLYLLDTWYVTQSFESNLCSRVCLLDWLIQFIIVENRNTIRWFCYHLLSNPNDGIFLQVSYFCNKNIENFCDTEISTILFRLSHHAIMWSKFPILHSISKYIKVYLQHNGLTLTHKTIIPWST